MNKIGIMQGRLLNHKSFEPQQFPWDNWEKEFDIAASYGVFQLEWMLNSENFQINPLCTELGLQAILKNSANSGCLVSSVCANFFMQNGIIRKNINKDNVINMTILCMKSMKKLGIQIMVIPMFESNEALTENELIYCIEFLEEAKKRSGYPELSIALESNWNIDRLIKVVHNYQNIGICYDLGNAAGNGYDLLEDINKLMSYKKLFHIHIKDKPLGGASVMLGQGNVNFTAILKLLHQECYQEAFILESFYEASNSVKSTVKNLKYIKNILNEEDFI